MAELASERKNSVKAKATVSTLILRELFDLTSTQVNEDGLSTWIIDHTGYDSDYLAGLPTRGTRVSTSGI